MRYHAEGPKKRIAALSLLFILSASVPPGLRASSEEEGSVFTDIPVGGRPAALGEAYTALANDAYASSVNPGGLGFLDATQFTGQHLSYLESSQYDHLGFGIPFRRSGVGGAIQYFGSGSLAGTDAEGESTGNFSSHLATYSLSYGRAFTRRLSLGLTGKMVSAQIADVAASAYAVDLGTMYQLNKDVTLAAVAANLGSKLTFLSEGDPLPAAVHIGAAYHHDPRWGLSAEGVFPRMGAASAHVGLELRPVQGTALRVSYRTDTAQRFGAAAGLAAGLGIQVNRLDVSYAWMPLADLGVAHYFSLGYRFDGPEQNKNGGSSR